MHYSVKFGLSGFALLLMSAGGAFGQGTQQGDLFQIPKPKNVHVFCSYEGVMPANLSFDELQQPSTNAQQVVVKMTSLAGIKRAPQVYASTRVENAAAAAIGKQLVIIYNPDFMKQLFDKAHGNRWTVISVLAHELGHHMNWHTYDKDEGSTPPKELDADYESGWIMKRLGASKEDAILAIQIIAPDHPTPTHPARDKRVARIKEGFDHKDGDNGDGPIGPDPFDPQRTDTPPTKPRVPPDGRQQSPVNIPPSQEPSQQPVGVPPLQRLPQQPQVMRCRHTGPCTHTTLCIHNMRPCTHLGPCGHIGPSGPLHAGDWIHQYDADHPFDYAHTHDQQHQFDYVNVPMLDLRFTEALFSKDF